MRTARCHTFTAFIVASTLRSTVRVPRVPCRICLQLLRQAVAALSARSHLSATLLRFARACSAWRKQPCVRDISVPFCLNAHIGAWDDKAIAVLHVACVRQHAVPAVRPRPFEFVHAKAIHVCAFYTSSFIRASALTSVSTSPASVCRVSISTLSEGSSRVVGVVARCGCL